MAELSIPTKRYQVTIELTDKLLASNSGQERGRFVFTKDKSGNVLIENYRVKGFFEEAAQALFYQDPEKVRRIRNNLFVHRTRLVTPKPPDGVHSRPVVVKAGATNKASMISSEYLAPGTRLTFEVEIIPADALSAEDLKLLLTYGEKRGMGQWRKAGFGTFKVVEFKEKT